MPQFCHINLSTCTIQNFSTSWAPKKKKCWQIPIKFIGISLNRTSCIPQITQRWQKKNWIFIAFFFLLRTTDIIKLPHRDFSVFSIAAQRYQLLQLILLLLLLYHCRYQLSHFLLYIFWYDIRFVLLLLLSRFSYWPILLNNYEFANKIC